MQAHILNVPDVTYTTQEIAQGAAAAERQAILFDIAKEIKYEGQHVTSVEAWIISGIPVQSWKELPTKDRIVQI